MKQLYKQLRELRGDEPLRDAAKRAGISHTYLNQLESGVDKRTGKNICPSAETLQRLSKAYNYPYGKLMVAAGYLPENENDTSKNDQFLDDLLYRIPDLTDEEKESLTEHMKFALKQIEKERERRASLKKS